MPNNSPQAQATPARTKAKAVFAPLSVVERLVSAFVLTSASVLCILSVFYPGLLFTAVNPGTAEKPQMTYPGALSLFGVLLGILLFFALLSALHWFRPEWEMLRSIQRWDVLCLHRTDAW